MKLVVPTITAKDAHEYRAQTELIAGISHYAHIDFAETNFNNAEALVDYKQAYLEDVLTSSVHLMYQDPLEAVKYFLSLPEAPRMIILQVESSSVPLLEAIKLIHDSPVLLGLALLQQTSPEEVSSLVSMADQVIIFSGNLGQHGGKADLNLLSKVAEIKKIKKGIEVAWDGGINLENISEISQAGVDVFYVGGAIHKAQDPYRALLSLQEKADKSTAGSSS